MIRLQRPATPPASLTTPAIQQYLADCAAWQADPTLPRPEKPVSYRASDLLAAFDKHFYAKCYLTEQRFESAWELDVDHFEPANQNPARVYDWDNLFPAAHKANMLRPRRLPVGGLLNPCVDDVENAIIYSLGVRGEAPGFQARDPQHQPAVNTAHLLDLLHNGRPNDADSVENTKALRRLIELKYKQVIEAWGEWNSAKRRNDLQEIVDVETRLKRLLSRRASFTMLIRAEKWVRKELTHLFD